MKKNSQLKRIREHQIIMIILLMLITVLLFVPHVNAQTITMANPDNVGQRDIMVYWSNGSFYGLYNTTSIITLDANGSYIFTLKPQLSNPLDNPATFIATTFAFFETNMVSLLVIIFLAAIWLGRR